MQIVKNPRRRDETRIDEPLLAGRPYVPNVWPAEIRSTDCGREGTGLDEAVLPEVAIDLERLEGIEAIRISFADSIPVVAGRSSDLRGRLLSDLGAAGRAAQEGNANE